MPSSLDNGRRSPRKLLRAGPRSAARAEALRAKAEAKATALAGAGAARE
jgi:hypothetical protein